MADLLGEGKPLEEVEGRFAPDMHPMDCVTVNSVAKRVLKAGRGRRQLSG